jgi:hypothetical protein
LKRRALISAGKAVLEGEGVVRLVVRPDLNRVHLSKTTVFESETGVPKLLNFALRNMGLARVRLNLKSERASLDARPWSGQDGTPKFIL